MKSVIAIISLLATVAIAVPVGVDGLGSTLSGVGAGSAPGIGSLESALGQQPTSTSPDSDSAPESAESASPSGEAQDPEAAQPQNQDNSSKDILSSLLGGVLKE